MATVIAYGTNKQAYFDLFIESCRRFNIVPVNPGWGRPWIGFGKKITEIRDYAAALPEDEILILVDPFDVVFLCGLDEIEDKFRKSGSRILCGAMRLGRIMQRVYSAEFNTTGLPTPKTPHGYDYLNSGNIITTAGFAVTLIDRFVSQYGLKPLTMDQEIFTTLYITGKEEVDLDWRCEIFHNLLFKNPLTRKPDMKDLELRDGRFFNTATGSYPSILHASGNALMEDIAALLGYDSEKVKPVENNMNFFKKAMFHIIQLRKEITIAVLIAVLLIAGGIFMLKHILI